MASDLKLRSIKVSDATWERWQAAAARAGVSVTALIGKCVDGYAVLEAEVVGLRQAEAAAREAKPAEVVSIHPASKVRGKAAAKVTQEPLTGRVRVNDLNIPSFWDRHKVWNAAKGDK